MFKNHDFKPFETKVWLSSPTMHGPEIEYVKEAYETNWMSGRCFVSKAYNDLLPMYVVRSMSRAGTPTDNSAMESINGWIKAELFMDFHVTGERPVYEEVNCKFFVNTLS